MYINVNYREHDEHGDWLVGWWVDWEKGIQFIKKKNYPEKGTEQNRRQVYNVEGIMLFNQIFNHVKTFPVVVVFDRDLSAFAINRIRLKSGLARQQTSFSKHFNPFFLFILYHQHLLLLFLYWSKVTNGRGRNIILHHRSPPTY